jgi:hypothetical protein
VPLASNSVSVRTSVVGRCGAWNASRQVVPAGDFTRCPDVVWVGVEPEGTRERNFGDRITLFQWGLLEG